MLEVVWVLAGLISSKKAGTHILCPIAQHIVFIDSRLWSIVMKSGICWTVNLHSSVGSPFYSFLEFQKFISFLDCWVRSAFQNTFIVCSTYTRILKKHNKKICVMIFCFEMANGLIYFQNTVSTVFNLFLSYQIRDMMWRQINFIIKLKFFVDI